MNSPPAETVQETAILSPVAPAGLATISEAAQAQLSALERNLKSASITIRMSHEECAQLRTRAADAGLTVSAYLRSCTFEAESLRAQVKDALSQLRAGESSGEAPRYAPVKRSWLHWPSRA
jgi:predicted lysophospholipase L1 biosynthesis ABC-type transport system permease subunit